MSKSSKVVPINPITKITKPAAKQIREAANAALAVLQQEIGITAEGQRGVLSREGDWLEIKFRFSVEGALSKEEQAFNDYQFQHPNWSLGDEFGAPNNRHKLIGFNARARKRPYIAECLKDGKHYVYTGASLAKLIGPSGSDTTDQQRTG